MHVVSSLWSLPNGLGEKMIFSKLEIHEIKKDLWLLMEKIRPQEPFRTLLDISYRIEGRSIEIL